MRQFLLAAGGNGTPLKKHGTIRPKRAAWRPCCALEKAEAGLTTRSVLTDHASNEHRMAVKLPRAYYYYTADHTLEHKIIGARRYCMILGRFMVC